MEVRGKTLICASTFWNLFVFFLWAIMVQFVWSREHFLYLNSVDGLFISLCEKYLCDCFVLFSLDSIVRIWCRRLCLDFRGRLFWSYQFFGIVTCVRFEILIELFVVVISYLVKKLKILKRLCFGFFFFTSVGCFVGLHLWIFKNNLELFFFSQACVVFFCREVVKDISLFEWRKRLFENELDCGSGSISFGGSHAVQSAKLWS